MSYSVYGSWTIEDSKSVGKKFRAKLLANYGYENYLTVGKEYVIEISKNILPMSPLCRGEGDSGKKFECHLERFEKIGEVKS